MGHPIDFPGSNRVLGPPKGLDETSVESMPTFTNGHQSVSCWEFTAEEIADALSADGRTVRLYLTVWSGQSQPPVYVGGEEATRRLIADNGTWKRG